MELNPICPIVFPLISCQSVSPNKPLQALEGGIQQLFDIWNNNNNNFIDRFQQQQQLEPINSTFIPGNEPITYIDTQISKQQAVQKRFYQQGLHKQQGKISRILSHLLESDKLW